MPAVTWIDMQAESSSRTSLKSLTDYLTESQDDAAVFTPSNRLCLSPETLHALDSAEKLVDHVERQLSQMHFDDSLTDDTEEDRFNGVKLNDECLRIDKVVKNMFQKGYYEPAPRPIFNKDHWKYTMNDQLSKAKRSERLSTPVIRRRVVEPLPVGECPLCKSNKSDESAKQMASDGHKAISANTLSAAAAAPAGRVEEAKVSEDKPEKLNVQRGPAISIKGPLAVQTARIVDIQPVQRIAAKRLHNIVTYECRHLEESQLPDASIADTNKLEQGELEIPADQRNSMNKSAFNCSRKNAHHKDNQFWDLCEEEPLDLEDFSLREPRILVEVDAVLQQQRNIIRQVHEATEKFDRFLSDRTLLESADASLENSFDDHLGDKRTDPRQSDKPKKLSSGIDDELGQNNKIDTSRQEKSVSMSRESCKSVKGQKSVSIRVIDESRAAAESKERSSSSTVVSEASNRIFQDSSKDRQYSGNFESESSADEGEPDESRSLKLECDIRVKNIRIEVSSNRGSSVQSSVHTQTKSNAGFVENLRNSASLKENNLAIILRQKAESISENDNSASIESDSVDKKLSEEKPHRVRISETDDERELHNYEFDADLLEGANEPVGVVTSEKNDEKLDDDDDDDVELRRDRSTDKLQDNPEENSEKTSHLIESISDVSRRGSSEHTKTSGESQKMSFASNNSKTELPKIVESSIDEAVAELSTESKIEIRLAQARDNLKCLMKTINFSVDNVADEQPKNLGSNEMDEQQSASNDVPGIMTNVTYRSNDARRQNSWISNSANVTNQECNDVPNDRSVLAMLRKNSDAVHNSLEQQKLLLLKNLESCSIGTPKRGRRFLTSTIVADTCPAANFTRESSTIRQQDTSSDSNSEGEIRMASTASYSLGEIPKSIFDNKSSCSTKGSTSTGSASSINNSSSLSAGEITGLNKH